MAIVTTDERSIALVDSVTERPIAGLRTFASQDHAEDFLRFVAAEAESGRLTDRDPRSFSIITAALAYDRWWEARVDPETGALLDRPWICPACGSPRTGAAQEGTDEERQCADCDRRFTPAAS